MEEVLTDIFKKQGGPDCVSVSPVKPDHRVRIFCGGGYKNMFYFFIFGFFFGKGQQFFANSPVSVLF